MDQAIQNAKILCPQYNFTTLIISTFNLTVFPNASDTLPEIFCDYWKWLDFTTVTEKSVYGPVMIASICLGIPSSIMALIIFGTKELSTVSFLYHRVINGLELLNCIILFVPVINDYAREWSVKSWFWMLLSTNILEPFQSLTFSVQLIIAWIAVERVLLCNSPIAFERINKKSVAWSIMACAIIFPFILYAPFAFVNQVALNSNTGLYMISKTSLYNSKFLIVYQKIVASTLYLQLALLIPASILSALSFLWVSKKKRQFLSKTPAYHTLNDKKFLGDINKNRQLCILQICEAIPVVIVVMLIAIDRMIPFEGNPMYLVKMPYEDAKKNLARGYVRTCLGRSSDVAFAFAHCCHMYRYWAFSGKVRAVTKRMFCGNKLEDDKTGIITGSIGTSKYN